MKAVSENRHGIGAKRNVDQAIFWHSDGRHAITVEEVGISLESVHRKAREKEREQGEKEGLHGGAREPDMGTGAKGSEREIKGRVKEIRENGVRRKVREKGMEEKEVEKVRGLDVSDVEEIIISGIVLWEEQTVWRRCGHRREGRK